MVAPANIGAEHILVRKPLLEQICLNVYNVLKGDLGDWPGGKGWDQTSISTSVKKKRGSSENDGRSNAYDCSELKFISNCCYTNWCCTNCSHLTWIYLNLPEFTRIFLNIPEFTQIHLILPEFTWIYLNLSEFSLSYWILQKCKWTYQNLPEFTWIHLNLPECTKLYLDLPEFTWI